MVSTEPAAPLGRMFLRNADDHLPNYAATLLEDINMNLHFADGKFFDGRNEFWISWVELNVWNCTRISRNDVFAELSQISTWFKQYSYCYGGHVACVGEPTNAYSTLVGKRLGGQTTIYAKLGTLCVRDGISASVNHSPLWRPLIYRHL